MNQKYIQPDHCFTEFPYNDKGRIPHSHDVYEKVPPITYAKGTIRRLVIADGRQVTEDPLGFGFIITSGL